MTGFNHGVTGAVIALSVKHPALAVPLAFLSHFACDLIPHFAFPKKDHFTRKFNIVIASDFLFAVLLMVILAVLFPAHKWLIWACMVAAASPDLMWAYHRLYVEHLKKRPAKLGLVGRFHSKIQWSQTLTGALGEGVWFLIMGAIILKLK